MRTTRLLPSAMILSLALAACQTETDPDELTNDGQTTPEVDDTGTTGDGGSDGGTVFGPDTNDGSFIDAVVEGLMWAGAGHDGISDPGGSFLWVDGDTVTFAVGAATLGTTIGQHTVSPLDLVPGSDIEDTEVLNLARFLQSLDRDGQAANGITISEEVRGLVDQAMAELGLTAVDWRDDAQVEEVILSVVDLSAHLKGHALRVVDAEEAGRHLAKALSETNQWRHNVSRTPDLATAKAKIDILQGYVAARKADGTLLEGDELEGLGVDGLVKPIIITYGDEIAGTDAMDAFAAISLDEGRSFKRINLSQSAHKSSYTLYTDEVAPGTVGKPNLKINGSAFLVSWSSKYCPSGNPGDLASDADPYQVTGPQGSVGYDEEGTIVEVPYSCLWTSRGWVDGEGEITVLKAEQLTSARRDAVQDFPAVLKNVAFAMVWQEDPEGLRPGLAHGPGDGGSGATVNHKTDIWYSYLPWSKFSATDDDYEPSGDPEMQSNEDGTVRPRALYPLSSPVRISDNNGCHWEVKAWNGADYCYDVCVESDANGFCVTEDGTTLYGDTGASRANLFLVGKTITNEDGSTTSSASVVLGYEETKGLGDNGKGVGPDTDTGDAVEADIGKNIIYHTFQYDQPDVISAGTVMSDLDLNARRVRFVVQSSSAAGKGDVRAVMLYREGEHGEGSNADIMVRLARGGISAASFEEARNLSSPSVVSTEVVGGEHSDGAYESVTDWIWTEDDLSSTWDANEYDDARAHRAQIRGDFIVLGYTWTPNWAAARRGHDHYDFIVRRSFDGGMTWTDAAGEFEQPRNLSNLPNNDESVIEPRIVATPGTLKLSDGTSYDRDVQDQNVYMVAYGTEENVSDNTKGLPEDIFYARTTDQGETYELVTQARAGTGQIVQTMDWLAHGEESQGECQMKTHPDGSTLFATWVQELDDETAPQSDVWTRVINFEATGDMTGTD